MTSVMNRNRGPAPSYKDIARQVAEQCLRLWQPAFPLGRPPGDSANRMSGPSATALPDLPLTVGSGGAGSGVLTVGLPWLSRACSDRWIGRRLVWWPRGIPEFRRIAIASSRLSRRLDQEHRWFDLLRTALIRVDPEQEAVIVVEGTAVAEIVRRAACILQKPTIGIHLWQETDPVAFGGIVDWISQRLSSVDSQSRPAQPHASQDDQGIREKSVLASECPTEEFFWPAEVSPEFRAESPQREGALTFIGGDPTFIGGELTPTGGDLNRAASPDEGTGSVGDVERSVPSLSRLPLADRLLFALASRVCVLSRRRGGHVESLIRHHIADGDRAEVLVFVAEDFCGNSKRQETVSQSTVVRWIVQSLVADDDRVASSRGGSGAAGAGPADRHRCLHREAPGIPAGDSRGGSGPLIQPEEWLLHWTRPRPGPWPNQSREDWMDELILGCRTADRSALACLLRIVGEGLLRASSEGIRGAFPVISFTEVPLGEFRRRRVFRGHRHRFDFEPWGIAIRRDLLQRLGARPVIYGSEDDWQELSAAERPFFQKAADDQSSTDNRAEREWRLCRDLSLAAIAEVDWCLFVENDSAAGTLSREVSCDVIVVPA